MKQIHYVLAILLLSATGTYGAVTDSLERQLQRLDSIGRADTQVVATYVRLMEACTGSNPQKGMAIAPAARKAALACNDVRGLIHIAGALGDNCFAAKAYPQALNAYREQQLLLRKQHDQLGMARCSNNMAKTLLATGLVRHAIQQYQYTIRLLRNEPSPQARQLLEATVVQVEKTDSLVIRAFEERLAKKKEYIRYLDKARSNQNRILLIALLGFIVILTIILLANINYRRKREEKAIMTEKWLVAEQAERQKVYNIIASELREPLNNFYEAVKLLSGEKNLFSLSESDTVINQSRESFRKSELLLLNLFAWTSLRSGNTGKVPSPRSVNLRQLTTNTINQALVQYMDKQLEVINDVDESITVTTDPARLTLVLWNLLDNAMKHSAPGSPIRVSAREKNKVIELAVRDRAGGISHAPESVFEFSSYSGQGSAGMGLHVCHLVTQMLEGEIWFETEPDAGTTFYFTLPR